MIRYFEAAQNRAESTIRTLPVIVPSSDSGVSSAVTSCRDTIRYSLLSAGSGSSLKWRRSATVNSVGDFVTAKPLEAQIGVLAELESIKKFGVTNEQLVRSKALIAQSRYHEMETVSGMAEDLAHHEALGDWKRSLSYLRAIQKVSADDVVRVAKKYLVFENLSAFEYLPESVTRTLTESDKSEEHTSELQSRGHLVCRLLL